MYVVRYIYIHISMRKLIFLSLLSPHTSQCTGGAEAERFFRDGAEHNHGKNGLTGAHSEHTPSLKKEKSKPDHTNQNPREWKQKDYSLYPNQKSIVYSCIQHPAKSTWVPGQREPEASYIILYYERTATSGTARGWVNMTKYKAPSRLRKRARWYFFGSI